MNQPEKKLFVSNFLVEQTPPKISVIRSDDGILKVDESKPGPTYNSTTSVTTHTSTSQWTESVSRTLMAVNMESIPEPIRKTYRTKEISDMANDTDQEPDDDSDYEQDYDIKNDDGKTLIDYEDTLRCRPPFAHEWDEVFFKLEK
jgi:hypothetical protein